MLSLLSVYTSALSCPTNIWKLCAAIDCCILSLIEYKLTLISFTENNCKR